MSRALIFLTLTLGGCAWFDDGPPSRSCRSNRDCFTAQGEVCDVATSECVTVDASAAAPEPTP